MKNPSTEVGGSLPWGLRGRDRLTLSVKRAPPLSFSFPRGGLTRRWYHGIMLSKTIFVDEVVPDTGPWLTWNKFKQFPVKYLFGKVTASSHCPQASRLVENGVKIQTHVRKGWGVKLPHTFGPITSCCSNNEGRINISCHFIHQKAETKVSSAVRIRPQIKSTLRNSEDAVVLDRDTKLHTDPKAPQKPHQH